MCGCSLASTARAAASASAIFDGAGVFVDDPLNFPGPWGLADELQASHFKWVAFHVNDGLFPLGIDPMWIAVFRAHGLFVGGWGSEEQHPMDDAVVANFQVQQYGLDFYIADAERPYEVNYNGGWRSKVFVDEFRQLQPSLPAALTTFGASPAPWVLPIDFASWRNAGFQLLPQAYYNRWKVYRPDLTVAHARRAGWPVDLVHPVIGVYDNYPASKYVPLLQTDGAEGFSVYLADQAKPTDYAALAPLAAAAAATSG
jgi:hypothetical protein